MSRIESRPSTALESSADPTVVALDHKIMIDRLMHADAAEVACWASVPRDAFWVAPNTTPPITTEVISGWSRKATHAWVVRERGRPVAYGELNPLEPTVRTWWLGHMLVNPMARGRGFCRILTRALLRQAFDVENAHEALLIVFPQNAAAIRAYKACGFQACGYEHDYYAPYDCTIRMMRMRATERTVKYG